MSLPLTFGCVWVFLAAIVAALPMRQQYAPGSVLLIAGPVLLGWIAAAHGLWVFGFGVLAFVSMFRKPLRYLLRRNSGEPPEVTG